MPEYNNDEILDDLQAWLRENGEMIEEEEAQEAQELAFVEDAFKYALKPLRAAMIRRGLTEQSLVEHLQEMLSSSSMLAKGRALDIASKWAGLYSPEKHAVQHQAILITNEPEDLNV
jgi:ElaB/YqjD/DUF883 family membrane-anchored ribosome-binding protein